MSLRESLPRLPLAGWRPWLALVVAVLLLGAGGEALRACNQQRERCLLDRLPVQPLYATYLTRSDGRRLVFGSPRCALRYLEAQTDLGPVEVQLTDELGGRPLPAEQAFLVRSKVETSRQDGNRIHVFSDEIEARRHALLYEGELLSDPFAPYRVAPAAAPSPQAPRP